MGIVDKLDNDGNQGSCKNSNEGGGVATFIDSRDENDGSNIDKEQKSIILFGSLMGLKREEIQDIYKMYCEHAREVGFSVRKTTTRSNDAGVVVEKYFVCSCEGSKRSTASNSSSLVEKKEKKGYITRTGCKASLRVKMNSEGVYEVVGHNILHNHTLTRKEWRHMHYSQRAITNEKAIDIGDMTPSGTGATGSFRYMTQDEEVEHSVGNTTRDPLNFLNRMKMGAIEGRDAQGLIDTLHQLSAEDQDFFFRVKLDDVGRLCNVFWRDSVMKEDYTVYGDVVVFDTTYRTNKYNLICAPFVGINNHWKNVMFGCAFIADEKTESFVWLMEVFKKSMEGQSPVTLFTDQDLAVGNAIEKVFPGTRHRLCRCHLYEDAVSQFGKLKGDKCFSDAFNKCLSGCKDETEFESCWNSMISKNGLEGHSWFKYLYDSREKWCTAINNDFFSVGMPSSRRSESTNSAIRFNAKKTTGLNEFYVIIKETVKCWRSNEAKDEFQCSTETPTSVLQLSGVMKHASEVYTLTLFKDFEEEFLKSISTSCRMSHYDNDILFYNVIHDDDVTCYNVTFSAVDNLISCSCKRFEECGLLCRHCLRVFHMHSVSQIPDCNIKRRWTKFAKKDIWDKFDSGIGKSAKVNDCIPWRHDIVRKYYNLVLKAQENMEARGIIEDGYNRDCVAVDSLVTMRHSTGGIDVSSTSINVLDPTPSIHDPTCSISKRKRSRDTSEELGSKTPNPRLFQ
ncbi:hypothetical protein OROMI_027709 [Orobanche minor]